MVLQPPGHRWVRLRHWMHCTTESIVGECHLLGLPGFERQPEMTVQTILRDAPAPPPDTYLHIIGGTAVKGLELKKPSKSSKAKKATKAKANPSPRRKKDPLSWLRPVRDSEVLDAYAAKHRLDYYTTQAGWKTVQGALELWGQPGVREVLVTLFQSGHTPRQSGQLIQQKMPHVPASMRRQGIIEAVQDLFWDFGGASRSEQTEFLKSYPEFYYARVAAQQGVDAALYRMRLVEIPAGHLNMIREVQQLSAAKLREWRAKPEAMDPRQLESLTRTFIASFEEERELRAREMPQNMFSGTIIDVTIEKPIPGIQEIMDRADRYIAEHGHNKPLALSGPDDIDDELEDYDAMRAVFRNSGRK